MKLFKSNMKKITLSYLFTMFVSITLGQGQQMDLLDSVIFKLTKDTVAFQEFKLLAKCNCFDSISNIKTTTKQFDITFNQMSGLGLIYPKLILTKKNLKSVFEPYQKKKLDSLLIVFRRYDEHFYFRKAPLLVCDKLTSNEKEMYELYLTLIKNKSIYTTYEYTLRQYLKDNNLNAITILK